MEDEVKKDVVCKRCGKSFKQDEVSIYDGQFYCSQCKIELAQQHIKDKETIPIQKTRKPNKIVSVGKWVLLIAFSVLIVINSVILLRVFFQQRGREYVVPDINKGAALCRSNLSEISEMLQEGRLPSDSIVCPVCGEPYKVDYRDGDTIVSCPDPGSHQLKALLVSKKNPIPEVIK